MFCHPERGSKLDSDWFRDAFNVALKVAGIEERIRIHDLRHACLTNMAATGASPVAIMATAGHRSMQTTKQYLHLAGVTFRDEASALERRLFGGGALADHVADERDSDDYSPDDRQGNAGVEAKVDQAFAPSVDVVPHDFTEHSDADQTRANDTEPEDTLTVRLKRGSVQRVGTNAQEPALRSGNA